MAAYLNSPKGAVYIRNCLYVTGRFLLKVDLKKRKKEKIKQPLAKCASRLFLISFQHCFSLKCISLFPAVFRAITSTSRSKFCLSYFPPKIPICPAVFLASSSKEREAKARWGDAVNKVAGILITGFCCLFLSHCFGTQIMIRQAFLFGPHWLYPLKKVVDIE